MNQKTSLSCKDLVEGLSPFFSGHLGDLSVSFSRVCPPESVEDQSLVFCKEIKRLPPLLESPASAIVIPEKERDYFDGKPHPRQTILFTKNVELALSATVKRHFLSTPYRAPEFKGVHPTAVIDPTAEIASDVSIAAHVVIGAHVKIAKGVFVGANTVIEQGSEIGEQSTIHPLVYIGHHTQIGSHCEVLPNSTIGKEGFGYAHDHLGHHHRIPHQGRVVLEDDVHVGSSCCFDRGTFGETRIGKGTIIDNQVHLAHNCKIGPKSIITARFAMAGSSTIGAGFITGGNSSVTGHVTVTDGVHLAGYSVVSKDVTKPGQYGGFPLLPLNDYLKNRAALAHLSEMRRQLQELVKKALGTNSKDGV